MDFSLYVIISPNVFRIEGSPLFDTGKITEVIQAGATAIQLREDSYLETSEFSKIAKVIHEVTKRHNIPLVIHDRVDIAVSSGAEGVELGKGCLDYNTARRIMGDEMFVGVAITTQRQAELASRANASYVVIGPVYKPIPGEFHNFASPPLGTAGVRDILSYCATFERNIPHLVSGGITLDNVQRVVFQSKTELKSVDGVVMHYPATEKHERMIDHIAEVKSLLKARPRFLPGNRYFGHTDMAPDFSLKSLSLNEGTTHLKVEELLPMVSSIITKVVEQEPVFGCLVPSVAKALIERMSAAVGSVPHFSRDFKEMNFPGGNSAPQSCLIQMDSVTSAAYSIYAAGLQAYNFKGLPVIFEPVGATGADFRRSQVAESLMSSGYVTLIKGNYTEILHLASLGEEGENTETVKGEKDQEAARDGKDKEFKLEVGRQCRKLALRERCVVLATGPVYVLSDGKRTAAIDNGSLFLAKAGAQALGSILAACMAVEVEDPFLASLSGLLLYTITSDQATENGVTRGPGTFLESFIDEIWKTSQMSADKNKGGEWTTRALCQQIRNLKR